VGIKYWFLKVCIFFRLVDAHDWVISLTDVGTWVVLVKIAISRQPSLPDLTALMAMLLARAHKKYIGRDAVANNATTKAAAEKATQALTMVGDLIAKHDKLTERVQAVDNRTSGLVRR